MAADVLAVELDAGRSAGLALGRANRSKGAATRGEARTKSSPNIDILDEGIPAMTDTEDALRASPADFAEVDWEGPLRGSRKVFCQDLADLYRRSLPQVDDVLNTAVGRVHRLLFELCGIVLRPKERGDLWGARLVLADQGRSNLPEDYSTQQWAVMADIAPRTENAGLRARLADLVWSMDRRRRPMADLAVDAYCDVVAGRLDGRFDPYLSGLGRVGSDDIAVAMRALQISAATQKGKSPADRPVAEGIRLYEAAKSERAFVAFTEIAAVVLFFDLVPPAVVGADAEALGGDPVPDGYEMAVQGLWRFAAEAYRRGRHADEERRCLLRAVDFTLARARAAPTGFVASHHLRAAIGELRTIRGTHAQRVELERELRDRQREGVGEYGGEGSRIDLTDMARAATTGFEGLSLSNALRDFAVIDRVKSVTTQEAEARTSLRDFPLANLFATQHLDADGKIVAEGPAGGIGDEPDPDVLRAKMRENAALHRSLIASGAIEPVRVMIGSAFDVTEGDLWPIVRLSPFIPPDHAALFALGFTRFLQGDLMSAVHLLIPQIEPALRHLLRNAGEEPSLLQSDLIQEERSLSVMLGQDRAALEAILGPGLTLAVDQIFNLKPPGLRHAMAHGLIDAGGCFSGEAIYAMWFLYHLTCLPLLDDWTTAVEPGVRSETFTPSGEPAS